MKCAKDDGGWQYGGTASTLQRKRRKSQGEGRRSGILPGSTGGPEVGCSTFLSLIVEEERSVE